MPSGYVSNFETVAKANEDSGKDVVNNFYAYIEEDGTVLLVEDKTDRQVAKVRFLHSLIHTIFLVYS
jgi:hypothetical protein